MNTILPIFVLMGTGLVLQQLKLFPADTDKTLNLYVIYIALPALILQQVPGLVFSSSLLAPFIMPWLVVLFSGVIVFLLCRFMGWSREVTGALLLMVPLGNTSFLGIPMIQHFIGSKGIPYAVLYDQFGSFLALSSYGSLILAFYSPSARPGFFPIIQRILLFPPAIALVTALYFHGITYPAWFGNLLSMTAKSMVPVVMVAIGFQMRLLLDKHDLLPLTCGLILRLLIVPTVFILACKALGISGLAVHVSLLETAMPPMVTAGALASIAGLRPELSSAMAAYGILLSFFTLPLINIWIK